MDRRRRGHQQRDCVSIIVIGRQPHTIARRRVVMVMIMDGGSVRVSHSVGMIRDCVYVKRQRLRLERADGHRDEHGEAFTQGLSVLDGPVAVNGRALDMLRDVRGWIYGAASAALFGISAPLSKAFLTAIPPIMLAGVLYLGAGLGLTIVAQLRNRPWPAFSKSDRFRLTCIALVGGFIAPTLLLYGLTRVSGIAGALLMNLEAVFTMVLATWIFGERLTPREWVGAVLILCGAVVLVYEPGHTSADVLGILAIAAACLGWAIDNNLTQQISSHDPVAIVQVKGLTAGVGNVLLAVLVHQHVATGTATGLALLVGFVCYGLSIVFDVYALRYLGAAREAAIFATAPFIGAAASIPILGDRLSITLIAAAVLMAGGLVMFRVRIAPLPSTEVADIVSQPRR